MSVLCYDSLGNPLKRLYQWDVNQTILITGLPDLPTQFHFCDTCNEIAYVVTPTAAENGYIVAVPNVLLEKDDPIILYSYQETGEDAYRTTYLIQIPVVPRSMPEGYIHGDNVEHYTVATVNARISWLIHMLTGDPSGEPTEDYAAEVVDMRDLTGNGTADYTIAGDALRAVAARVTTAEGHISDLLYEPIAILTFTVSPNQAEVGDTVNNVTLSYTLNQVPHTLSIGSTSITPVSSGTTSLTSQGVESQTEYTLTATDEGSPSNLPLEVTEHAYIKFYYKAYWGVSTVPSSVDSAFVTGLGSSALATTVKRNISVNSTGGKYIWYAVPDSIDTRGCKFKVDPSDFFGGFNAAITNVSVTNSNDETTTYNVYRSTYPDLGSTTVHIESN